METNIKIGPQQEIIQEFTVGTPVRSALAGLCFRVFNRAVKPLVPDRIARVLALDKDSYAAVVWAKGGFRIPQALRDVGYHDADAPGGKLTPPPPGKE